MKGCLVIYKTIKQTSANRVRARQVSIKRFCSATGQKDLSGHRVNAAMPVAENVIVLIAGPTGSILTSILNAVKCSHFVQLAGK